MVFVRAKNVRCAYKKFPVRTSFTKQIFTLGEELGIGIPSGTLPDIPDSPPVDTSGMPHIPPPVNRIRLRRIVQGIGSPLTGTNSEQVDTPTRQPMSTNTTNSSSSGQ